MEKETLVTSIRENAAQAIAAIREKAVLEIGRLDDAYAAEMDDFRKRIEAKTEARILQEISRQENRAALDCKKMQLQKLEQLINRTVDEVRRSLRDHFEYRPFLLKTLKSEAEKISGNMEVRISKEDLPFRQEMLEALETAGTNRRAVVREDPGVSWGGFLIVDEAAGRILNNTIERIYFRKSLLIRQTIVKILREHAGNRKDYELPAVNA